MVLLKRTGKPLLGGATSIAYEILRGTSAKWISSSLPGYLGGSVGTGVVTAGRPCTAARSGRRAC